jgi:hypothetical protein
MPKTAIVFCALIILVGYYIGSGLHQRCYDDHGIFKRAWFVTLPGYTTGYQSRCSVDLRPFVGTHYDGLVAINKKDGSNNP